MGIVPVEQQIVECLPKLRAFALSLTYNTTAAEDLIQETALKAFANLDKYREGTNLIAWLFTIMRNSFHTQYRRNKRMVEDADGSWAAKLASSPSQDDHIDCQMMRAALTQVPDKLREALFMVAVSGLSYEEAGRIMNVACGTIKSRVHRARKLLGQLLAIESLDDIGPGKTIRGVLTNR